jgi:hypothetical protein
VVVAGGLVVVVVGGLVTGGEVIGAGPAGGAVVVVVGATVVVVVMVVGVAVGVVLDADGRGDLAPADVPGCSRATVTPRKVASAPERTTAPLVTRRIRVSARARAAGENRPRLITDVARVPAGVGWRRPWVRRQRTKPT